MTISASGSFQKGVETLREKMKRALAAIRKQLVLSKLPVKIANKIFESFLIPILTYGSEVWGAYEQNYYDSWDRTSAEKGHLYFCKSYLGVNRKATNIACRTEMGRFPLKVDIDIHILNNWISINLRWPTSAIRKFKYSSTKK